MVISEVPSRGPAAHRSLSVVSEGGENRFQHLAVLRPRGRAKRILARFRVPQERASGCRVLLSQPATLPVLVYLSTTLAVFFGDFR
jgi:hypothetical protein